MGIALYGLSNDFLSRRVTRACCKSDPVRKGHLVIPVYQRNRPLPMDALQGMKVMGLLLTGTGGKRFETVSSTYYQ